MKKFNILFVAVIFEIFFVSTCFAGPEGWPKPWFNTVSLQIGAYNPYSGQPHATWLGNQSKKYAVDFLGTEKTELFAPAGGRIVCSNLYSETTINTSCASGHGGYGYHVIIEPDGDSGNTYIMAHLNETSKELPLFTKSGNSYRLEQCELVGYLGKTGSANNIPHLHFELIKRNETERDSINLFGITKTQFLNRNWIAGSLVANINNTNYETTGWSVSNNELTVSLSSNQTLKFPQINSNGDKYFIVKNLPKGTKINLPDNWSLDTVRSTITISDTSKTETISNNVVKIYGKNVVTLNYDGLQFTARQTNGNSNSNTSYSTTSWSIVNNELVVTYTSSSQTFRLTFAKQGSNGDEYFMVKNLPSGTKINLPDGWSLDTDSRAVNIDNSSKTEAIGTNAVRIYGSNTVNIKYNGIQFTARRTNGSNNSNTSYSTTSWSIVNNELVVIYTSSSQTFRLTFPKQGSNGDEYFMVKNLPSGTKINLPTNWSLDTDSRAVTISNTSKTEAIGTNAVRIYGSNTVNINYNGIQFTARQINENNKTYSQLPVITTTALKDGKSGQSYSETLKASGVPPFTWSASGLPEGLNINPQTGQITGTFTQSRAYSVPIITATNKSGFDSKTFSLRVLENSGVEPKIKTNSLKNGTVDKPYYTKLQSSGTAPITWSSEYLPGGLTLNASTGEISGTTPIVWNAKIKFIATNSAGSSSKDIKLTIKGVNPKITTAKINDAVQNQSYSTNIEATGTSPIIWTATGLPKGLDIDPFNGIISGTPEESGKFTVKVNASNPIKSVSKNFKITVSGFPTIITTSLKSGTINKSYNMVIKAKAIGAKKFTWSAENLTDGLKINSSTGKISGKPSKAGIFNVKIIASIPNTELIASKDFSLEIKDTTKSKSNTISLSELKSTSENNTQNFNDEKQKLFFIDKERSMKNLTPNEIKELEGYEVAAILPKIKVNESGQYDFEITLDEKIKTETELFWFAFSDNHSEDDEIADFYNSSGEDINCVPDEKIITVSAWLNSGVIYRPVIAVKNN